MRPEKVEAGETRHRIYVASSWRNEEQVRVVEALRADGHEVYDYRHPTPGDSGFSWRQIEGPPREQWTAAHFANVVLDHPVAKRGFDFDMTALEAASACVIVLPCGRSAHLEHGYAVGQGKLTVVYQATLDEPELMYRMCDYFATTLAEVRLALSRGRPAPRWQRDFDRGGTPEFANRCAPYHHRTCKVCGGCWRHGSCTCGPERPRPALADEAGGARCRSRSRRR